MARHFYVSPCKNPFSDLYFSIFEHNLENKWLKLDIFLLTELTAGCDQQVSWIKDQTLVDQTNANNIKQGRVQFSIVEAGPRDAGLYELLTDYNDEEHRAAFAINVL